MTSRALLLILLVVATGTLVATTGAVAWGAVAWSPSPGNHEIIFAPSEVAASTEVDAGSTARSCHFPSYPTVVKAPDNGLLQYWKLEKSALWLGPLLPTDSAYVRYRRRIEEAGADLAQPVQYVPEPERNSEQWRRELHNVETAYSGQAGTLRPVRCLEALLFAYQNTRHSQLERPTEFIASVLRKRIEGRTIFRLYFGAGDELFPPKEVYGFDEVERDVASGWEYVAMLHNHTIQDAGGELRLGVPAPSIADVQLLNSLVEDYGLERAWITNGLYTLDLSATDLAQYLGPE